MNTLLLANIEMGGWMGLLFKIAVICIVFWGISELIKWAGWPIPRPVIIVAICLFAVLLIYWLFQLFGMLM